MSSSLIGSTTYVRFESTVVDGGGLCDALSLFFVGCCRKDQQSMRCDWRGGGGYTSGIKARNTALLYENLVTHDVSVTALQTGWHGFCFCFLCVI